MLGQTKLATAHGIEDGTAIGMGLANAANMVADADAKSKVVILLTDGVNNAGQIDPLTAADAPRRWASRSTPSAWARPARCRCPRRTCSAASRSSCRRVRSTRRRCKPSPTRPAGATTGPRTSSGLRKIYDEINALEKSEIEIQTFASYQELAGWLLAPGLLLLLGELVPAPDALQDDTVGTGKAVISQSRNLIIANEIMRLRDYEIAWGT
jgi:Ca-activated chloride channel family protein